MVAAALGPLEGYMIGITAERRWKEQSDLLALRGARVLHGPMVSTRFISDETLRETTEALTRSPPDFVVANTGAGMRSWLEAARAWGLFDSLVDALRGATIVARGAKAASAVQSVGLPVTSRARSETLGEVAELLSRYPLEGRNVALQLDGVGSSDVARRLQAAGARVVPVPVYELSLPRDDRGALRLIRAVCDRKADAVTFTSAPAVHNLFTIAARHGLDDDVRRAFNESVVASCVGPVCAGAAREEAIDAPVAPEVGRLGLLVRTLTDHLAGRRREFRLGGEFVSVQGSVTAVGERVVMLSARERAVLEVLAERPGAVVSAAGLERRVWRSVSERSHRVEVTVTRLRRRLGPCGDAIVSIPRRGYRIDPNA